MSIRRNTTYNLISSLLPIAVSLVTVPLYLQHVGVERYGVLAIVWMLLGYFGFFDLGLPRATANQIAKMGDATPEERQEVVWTALVLNAGVGLLGGLVVYLVAPPLLENVFKMAEPLRLEVMSAMPWIGIAIPLATVTGVLVGALDGRERFMSVNVIQVFGTALFQIIPLAIAIVYGADLKWIIAASVLTRAATLIALYKTLASEFPNKVANVRKKWIKPLLRYGGWVSVTSAIIPVLETFDRFLIGAFLGARAVAIYTVPFNLISRLRILPGAINRTLFPRLSAQTSESAENLAIQSMMTLAAILTPLVVVAMFTIKPFLVFWVGQEVAREAAPLAATFLVGIWINSIAHIPFGLVEAKGRPDLIAKLHLFTLPFFIGLLWLGAHWGELPGVAIAWSARVWLDSNILFTIAGVANRSWRQIWPGAILIFVAWIVSMNQSNIVPLGLMLIALAVSWSLLSDTILRQLILCIWKRVWSYSPQNIR